MKNIKTLNQEIETLQNQKQELSTQRYECRERFSKNLTNHFSKYFRGVISEDIKINGTSSGIYFYKMNEEGTYEKELFNIYLRESYLIDKSVAYTECSLSYYSTSTNSDFELERLVNLGKVANVVKDFKDEILKQANGLAEVYNNELKEDNSYEKEYEIDKQITSLRNEIRLIVKEQTLKDLMSEGVKFEKDTYIQLKANFTARVKSIKLIDISKSCLTATAVFEYVYHNQTSREERVSIQKIVDQVNQYKISAS